MKVVAKCWINHGGDWYRPGEVLDVKEIDEDIMAVCTEPEPEKADSVEAEEPARRGRKRKSDE